MLGAGGGFRFSIPDRSRVWSLATQARDSGALVVAAGPVGAQALPDQLGEPRAERPREVQPTAKQTSVTVRSPRRSSALARSIRRVIR